MLAEFLGLDLSLNTELAEMVDAPKTDTDQDLTHLTENVLAPDSTTAKAATTVLVREKHIEADKTDDVARAGPSPEAENVLVPSTGEDTLSAEAAKDTVPQTLSEIVQTWQPLMEEFQLGQTTIKASFDVSDIDAFALFDLIDTSATERSTNVREFDNLAQRLIEFLEAKDGDIGFIELEREVIMIDRSAVTGGETDFIQWEAADGRTISFIGLASDFQQFDMIA